MGDKNAEYLVSHGWRLVRNVRRAQYSWQAWEHPDHQHDRRGFFQKTEALDHQKRIDKGFKCDCLIGEKR